MGHFKVSLKSLTVLDVASTFRLLVLLVRPAASKTDTTSQQRPLSFSPPAPPPNQQAPLFMRGCYCWAAFRNKRKLKSLAVQRHPKLREQQCWVGGCGGGVWLRKNERQKFLSFPAGVFQIPQATASRLCE